MTRSRDKITRIESAARPSPEIPASYPRLWSAVAAIAPGSVASYGEVARRAGLPKRARLVAQALKAAPEALALPWHRVLRADGRIAFPAGSAAFREQARLLRREGVTLVNGRVRQVVPAQTDLDAMLWRR